MSKVIMFSPFQNVWSWAFVLSLLLIGANVASGMGVVFLKHKTRIMHSSLQELKKQQHDLKVEWGQLVLEQGTFASNTRVDEVAQNKLGMIFPKVKKRIVVKP